MALNPPICLEVAYYDVADGILPNEYTATFTTSGQTYDGGAGQYDCTSLTAGMWTSNSGGGYAFRIKSLSKISTFSCNVVLEDVSGFNIKLD